MTVYGLVQALVALPVDCGDHEVVVAGRGVLSFVTRAAAEDTRRVVVLYIEEPPPEAPSA